MGNQKLKWTAEEEDALKAGVAKYGTGKWKNILVDSQFKHKLAKRSNVDLKDKWRNMGACFGPGSGASTTTPQGKTSSRRAQPSKIPNASSGVVAKDNFMEKSPDIPENAKKCPKYNEMILEALSSIKDCNGSDFDSILEFIEKKYEVPQNFRKPLIVKLRKLVTQGKLEKVNKKFKIKHASLAIKTPSPKHRVVSKPRQESRPSFSAELVEDAAERAANKIAEAEHKSLIAAEAVQESERVSRMAEDSEAVYMHLRELLKEIIEHREHEANNRSSKRSPFEGIHMA